MKRLLKHLKPISIETIWMVDMAQFEVGVDLNLYPPKGGANKKDTGQRLILLFGFTVGFCDLSEGQGFFRLNNGWGMKWKDLTKHELIFSERHGYDRGFQICKWKITFLKRDLLPK